MQTSYPEPIQTNDSPCASLSLIGRLRLFLAGLEGTGADRKNRVALITASVLFYLVWNGMAATRQLWHDELFTFYIAGAPSIGRLWQELRLDLNPPLNYLAVRMTMRLFGTSELAVRTPSLIAFFGASVCFGTFAARWLGRRYGVLAVLALWATPFLYYAAEARAYALVLLFFMLALLTWQAAAEAQRGRRAVIGLAAAMSGLAVTHLFVVFWVLPLALAELVRTFGRRRVDWAVWGAMLGPCTLASVFFKILARYREGAVSWPFRASFAKAAGFYAKTLSEPGPAFLLYVGITLLVFYGRKGYWAGKVPGAVAALFGGLLILPVVMNAGLQLIHGGFFERYSIPTALAFAFGLAWLVSRASGGNEAAAVWCGWILLAHLFVHNHVIERAASLPRTGGKARVAMATGRMVDYRPETIKLLRIEPDLPLVAASGLTFLEMDRYEPAQTVNRLYYLSDRKLALQYANALLFEGFQEDKKYFPIRAKVERYRTFFAQHPRFLVLGTPDYPEDWLIPAMLQRRAQIRFLGEIDGPYKDHELFEVSVN